MPETPTLSGQRVAGLAATAAVLHGAFDAVTYRFRWARPPYLRMEDAPDVFQMLSPVAISVAICSISGIIAVVALAAVPPRQRRPLVLGIVLTAFWLFSALLLRAVWLSTPWAQTLVASALGLPRGLAIGWCLARLAVPRVIGSTGAVA